MSTSSSFASSVSGRWLSRGGALVLLALGSTLAVVACSDDSSGGGGSTSGPTLDALGDTLAIAICDVQKECFGSAFAAFAGTTAECRESFAAGFNEASLPTIKASIDAKKIVYTPSEASACLDKIKALGCGVQTARISDLCQGVLAGQVAAGGECQVSSDCGAGNYCDVQADCPGKCAPRLADGGTCKDSEDCQAGLVCAQNKCAKPAPKGAACDGGQECVAGTICAAKVCQAFDELLTAPLGGECSVFESLKLCADALPCAIQGTSLSSPFTCVAKAASGAACKYSLPDMCPLDEFCGVNLGTGKAEGTCTKRRVEGEACEEGADNSGCARGFSCNAEKKCHKPSKNGEACKDDNDCYGVCEKGVCVAETACNTK
jgi:hypothetical protein